MLKVENVKKVKKKARNVRNLYTKKSHPLPQMWRINTCVTGEL